MYLYVYIYSCMSATTSWLSHISGRFCKSALGLFYNRNLMCGLLQKRDPRPWGSVSRKAWYVTFCKRNLRLLGSFSQETWYLTFYKRDPRPESFFQKCLFFNGALGLYFKRDCGNENYLSLKRRNYWTTWKWNRDIKELP